MRYLVLPAVISILFSCTASKNSSNQLIEMELGRSKAIEFHDSATLKNIYADDFSGVAAGGLVVNKSILLEVFKRHGNDLIFVNDDHKVRFVDKKLLCSLAGSLQKIKNKMW